MRAIQFAYETTRKQLLTGVWNQGAVLPSLATLAQECSVSRTTMWKAVGLLQKESLLHVRMRGKIVAGPPGVNPPDSSAHGYGFERLKTSIGGDLLSGRLPVESLPSTNKLALQYGVAVNTLKKSLNALVDEGMLVRKGCRYRNARNRGRSSQRTMILVFAGDPEKGVLSVDWRLQRLAEAFERECSRLGFKYQCEGFLQRDPKGFVAFTEYIRKMSEIGGVIVSLWNPRNETYWRRWMDLLGFLADRNIPVIVVDQEGDLIFPALLTSNKNLRILRIAGERAGEMVAAHLLRHGHQRIAYIAPLFNTQWAQARYAGLSRHCKQYGAPRSSVGLFGLEEAVGQDTLALALMNVDEDAVRALYGERLSKEQLRGLAESLSQARQLRLQRRPDAESMATTIDDLTRFLLTLVRKKHDALAYDTILSALEQLVNNNAMETYLDPLFNRALEPGNGATWVCSDDKTAILSLFFLKRHKKRVPQEIAVHGFENWREASEWQLSSYDFNMNGIVQEALLMIMDEKKFRSRPPISEVDGYVVERRTTRR